MIAAGPAADERSNEHLGVLALHALFVREHNRRATELANKYPFWTNDQLYPAARRFVTALIQVLYTARAPVMTGCFIVPSV
jgi:peroxidase